MGTVSKLLRLRNGRLPPSVNELGNLDPSRSSPEGHNQIRVSTPASFRRIGQRSSSRPVSPLPVCPAPPQGIALRMLTMASAAARAAGRRASAFVTATVIAVVHHLTHSVPSPALVALLFVPPIRAELALVPDFRDVSLLAFLVRRPL